MRTPLLLAATALLALAGCVTDMSSRPPRVSGLPRDDAAAPISAVWIGHATVLMRLGTKTVLADANFSNHQFLYPRLTAASCKPGDLAGVDVALVSHLHNDHYDVAGLRALPSHPPVIYPAGAQRYARGVPGEHLFLGSWESVERDGVRITAVPARHVGGRFALDALWNHSFTGYIVEADGRAAYFAGDTGYDPELFKEIGRRFPKIDVAFIPIAPARGGNENHASPAEALQIFQDLGARYLVPIHYESFYSSLVPYDEPRRLVLQGAAERGLTDRVFALRTGERLIVPGEGAPVVMDELPAAALKLAQKSP